MSNPFYNVSGAPVTGSPGSSAVVRSEFAAIAAAFGLMPALTAGTAVVINPGGTALSNTVGGLALAGNFATTGAFNTTLVQGASISLTLPTTSGTLATLAGTETLSNKTLVAPALGTPASGVLTNCTGTASGLTAGTVTTNANLTGPITSSGNVTAIASQTGTGSKIVVDTSPTLVTPTIGVATATTINGVTIPTASDTAALLGKANQAMTGGVLITPANLGTKSSGTLTIACGTSPMQYVTNGGAFTLAAPAADGNCLVLITNNGSAGAVTFSGFSVGASTGDPLTTTNASVFTVSLWRINGVSGYRVAAMQ